MEEPILCADSRIEVAKLMIWLVKFISQQVTQEDHFGSSADDVILYCAIFIGQAEYRPMSALKLAHFTGIPRPTVIRKLQSFVRAGYITIEAGIPRLRPERLNDPSYRDRVRACVTRIKRSADIVSRMDI